MNLGVGEAIAQTMGPQALPMNYNTLQRHGVFEDVAIVRTADDRFADENQIHRSSQFPYRHRLHKRSLRRLLRPLALRATTAVQNLTCCQATFRKFNFTSLPKCEQINNLIAFEFWDFVGKLLDRWQTSPIHSD